MSDETLESGFPGVGRLNYFLARVLMIVVMVFAVINFGPESAFFRVLSLIMTIAGIVLDVMRLRNIGVSEWFVFLRFLPWVGLFMAIGLQSAQAGWIESKRLDRAGWAIVGAHAALIALILFLVLRAPGAVLLPEFFYLIK